MPEAILMVHKAIGLEDHEKTLKRSLRSLDEKLSNSTASPISTFVTSGVPLALSIAGAAFAAVTRDPNLAGGIATAATASLYAPQVLHTWNTRSTKDISPQLLSLDLSATSTWTIYGAMVHSVPIIVADALALSGGLYITRQKLREMISAVKNRHNKIEQEQVNK
jgi:MtN3 and saliva related transmembrane protein